MSGRAVVFVQLGGPESQADVRGFLYRLFADPEVIRIRSGPLRKLVAAAVAFTRAPTSKKMYRRIGGGSPIRRLTDGQAAGVERLLRDNGRDVVVRAAMTCSRPFVEDVVRELAAAGVRRWLAFPLYPQYSFTTTKGAIERVRAAVARFAPESSISEISSFPTDSLFVEAHAELILRELARFPEPNPGATTVLFSAHSIPKKLVTIEGDPYQRQIEETVAAIRRRIGPEIPAELAYQSKIGPVEWLGPSTPDILRELGRRGIRQVLVVPVAFVTDHIETLFEIDLLFGDIAREAGITSLRRTPGLNSQPTFLKSLRDIVLARSEFWAGDEVRTEEADDDG